MSNQSSVIDNFRGEDVYPFLEPPMSASACKSHKHRWTVIVFRSEMMDLLARFKNAAYSLFNNQAMLRNIASRVCGGVIWSIHHNVIIGIKRLSSFPPCAFRTFLGITYFILRCIRMPVAHSGKPNFSHCFFRKFSSRHRSADFSLRFLGKRLPCIPRRSPFHGFANSFSPLFREMSHLNPLVMFEHFNVIKSLCKGENLCSV